MKFFEDRVLTGEYLKSFQSHRKISVAMGATLALLVYVFGNKFHYNAMADVVVLVILLCIALFEILTGKTRFQLRKKELVAGKAEAQKILDDAGITNGKK